MFCPNCDSEIPEEAKFCPKCGFSLKKNAKSPEKVEVSPNINVSPTITASGNEEAKVEFSPNINISSIITTEIKEEKIGSIGEILSEGATKISGSVVQRSEIGKSTNERSGKGIHKMSLLWRGVKFT
ncbi:MAG: zinc ribbon domain-containing protein [archaeon]|nr:zinc ribbon domain-containing protein [archaeon]